MSYTITPLAWDSAHFDCPCAKVQLTKPLTKQEANALFEEAKPFRFVTISNPDQFPENNALLASCSNIIHADTNILLHNPGPGLLPAPIPFSDCVQIADNISVPDALLTLAKNSFIHSRFYADPHISAEKAGGVFENWVKNAQNKEGKYFCICKPDDAPAGFLLFHTENTEAVIELICVSPAYRGKGVATAMLQAFGHFCQDLGIRDLYVGTQERNLQALSVYRKNMYQDEKVTYTFHMWNE